MIPPPSTSRRGRLAACAWLIAVGSAAQAQDPKGQATAPATPAEESAVEPAALAGDGWWGGYWDDNGYEQGFRLSNPDGSAALRFGGLLRAEGRWNGAERRPQSEYDLDRLRLDIAGRFRHVFRFRLEPSFVEDGVELEEAWVGLDVFRDDGRFMAGRMRVPFGLEEMRAQEHVDLPRLSIMHQFTPAEDTGLFLFGQSANGVWEYGASVSNGTGGADTNGDKDLAARLVVHPFDDSNGKEPRGMDALQIGGALTFGIQDGQDIGGETIDNAAGLPLMVYAPGVTLDGRRTRLGLEAAWYSGPWFVQGEVMRISQGLSLDQEEIEPDYNGGYLDLSYVLTGESKSFQGVTPKHPIAEGGWGAWVLALRYSELHTEGELEARGFLLPDTWVGRVRSIELGVNWVLDRHAMLRAAVVHSDYSNDVTLGSESVSGENAAILQFQVSF